MKRAVIELVNEEMTGGSDARIAVELENIIRQSLEWWHEFQGNRDLIKLDKWKISEIEIKDVTVN
jgi:hypothetical protein